MSSTTSDQSSEPSAELRSNESISGAERPIVPADIIGELLVETGLLKADQLRRVRRIQDRLPNATNLVTILEELHLATREQVREALKSRKCRVPVRLTDLLVELGYIRESDLKLAVSIQK